MQTVTACDTTHPPMQAVLFANKGWLSWRERGRDWAGYGKPLTWKMLFSVGRPASVSAAIWMRQLKKCWWIGATSPGASVVPARVQGLG